VRLHAPLPTGTVTLLFSDIEDSTARLAELGADRYHAALEQHRRILRDAVTDLESAIEEALREGT